MCSTNSERKQALWFCNKPLSPLIIASNIDSTPSMDPIINTNEDIQDSTITTSDESVKNSSTFSASLAEQVFEQFL